MSGQKLQIKTSPVTVIKRLFVIEIILAVIVILLSLFVDVIILYSKFPFSDLLSATTFSIILTALLQIIFLITTFISWYFDNYEITPQRVVRRNGVLFKKKQIYPTDKITSITQSQGIVGNWLNYASIELQNGNGALVIIPDVYKAQSEIEKIEEMLKIDSSKKMEEIEQAKPEALLSIGEGKNLEYKASFRWDIDKGAVSKDLESSIIRTVTAFMNSEGGKLLLGVDDDGKVVGLENDFNSIKKKNEDSFENHFTTIFTNHAGTEFTQYYTIQFELWEGKKVCVISIKRSPLPVYFKDKNTDRFYVRAGNSTRELNVREAVKYINSNFKSSM